MAINSSKPRVAIYYDVLQSTGMRDDGCPLFINYNLRKMLNDSVVWEDHRSNVSHLSPCMPTSDFGHFDLHVLCDYGEDALGLPLDWELPHPNAYWVSDAHLGYDYRLKRAKQFDHVFVAQRSFIDRFIADGIPAEKIHYMPHAFEPDVYKPIPIIEKHDWTFVGYPNSQHRIDMLDRFIKEFPNYYLGWRIPGMQGHNELDDVNAKYNQSRLIINDAVKMDLNMRVFETLGAGRCLITQDIPEIQEHFKSGEHLFLYKTMDEAVDCARMLLKMPDLIKEVANKGHLEALSKHTYMHRAQQILKTTLNYAPQGELLVC